MLLIVLLILALALVAGGFVIKWLFIAAVVVALVTLISWMLGGTRRGGAL